jgi:Uma2 family endonuclease
MAADPMVDLRRRFTVDEYELMGRAGVLGDDRTELLDGEIVLMSPIGPRHASVVDTLTEALYSLALGRVAIRVQNPVRLIPRSEPQPDIVVARRRRDRYSSAHPTSEDTLLVVEVADSSLHTDRAIKLPIYAREGIVEVWIIDLTGGVVYVHTDPAHGAYRTIRTLRPGEMLVPTAVEDVELPVAEILGQAGSS